MSPSPRRSPIRPFGRGQAARRAPDLADMGTAFALDEALERGAVDSLLPGATPSPRPAVAVAPWRLWLGRKLGG